MGAGCLDQEGILFDHFLEALLDEIGTILAPGDGLLHVRPLHQVVPGLPRPVICLTDDVGDVAQPTGEFALVLAQPGPFLDDARQGG